MKKAKKSEVVVELAELFEGANGVYSIDFTGLDVANTLKLRRAFRAAGVTYRVAKNTLVRRALTSKGGYDEVTARLIGQSGIAVGYEDPAAPARVLKEFIDPKLEIPKLNFAVIDGQVFDSKSLNQLASMPSRKELLGQIVSLIDSPATGIVGAINAVMRDLSSVIEEVARSREAA